jgi:hypothetical protein
VDEVILTIGRLLILGPLRLLADAVDQEETLPAILLIAALVWKIITYVRGRAADLKKGEENQGAMKGAVAFVDDWLVITTLGAMFVFGGSLPTLAGGILFYALESFVVQKVLGVPLSVKLEDDLLTVAILTLYAVLTTESATFIAGQMSSGIGEALTELFVRITI